MREPHFLSKRARLRWRYDGAAYLAEWRQRGHEPESLRIVYSVRPPRHESRRTADRWVAWAVEINDEEHLTRLTSEWGEPAETGSFPSLGEAMKAAEWYVRSRKVWEHRSRLRNFIGRITGRDAVEFAVAHRALNRYYLGRSSRSFQRLIAEQILYEDSLRDPDPD